MMVLIISNGDISDINLNDYIKYADIVICADGGARHLYNESIVPDIIIGDLDSLDSDIIDYFLNLGVEFEKHSVHKDKSDTELAIDYAIDKCANDIVLLGVTGSRLDHTIANISVLYKLAKQNINAVIIDSHNEIYLIKDRLKLSNKDNHFVSIIPLTDSRVTLRGFEYETHSMDFQVGTSLGISNLIKDKEGEIEINSGVCLVIRSKD